MSRARACSTASPARGRSGWRRCRAARPPARSSSATAAPSPRCAPTSRRSGVADRCTVRATDVRRSLRADAAAGRQYDLFLIDPPYRMLIGRSPCTRPASRRSRPGRRASRAGVGGGRGAGRARVPARPAPARGRRVAVALHPHGGTALSPNIAICPGTYDPVTLGHLDIIRRAAGLFDEGRRRRRPPAAPQGHDVHHRGAHRVPGGIDRGTWRTSQVLPFSNLVVEFARDQGASALVKGLRAVSDFEWEFQMNHLNKRARPRHRDGLPDELANLLVRLVERCPGDRRVRRPRDGSGSGTGRAAPSPRDTLPARRLFSVDVLVLIDKLDDLVHQRQGRAAHRPGARSTARKSGRSSTRCARRFPRRSSRRAGSSRSVRRCSARPSARPSASSRRRARSPSARRRSRRSCGWPSARRRRSSSRPRQREREVRLGAEDYADQILSTLETNLGQVPVRRPARPRAARAGPHRARPDGHDRGVHRDHDAVAAHVRPALDPAEAARSTERGSPSPSPRSPSAARPTRPAARSRRPSCASRGSATAGVRARIRGDAARPVPPLPRGRRGRPRDRGARSTRTTIRSRPPRTT